MDSHDVEQWRGKHPPKRTEVSEMVLLRRISTVALTVMMLAALLAPSALAKRPDKEVPLKGDFAGVGAEFSGNFSHLGKFTGVVDLDDSDGIDDTVWTAANGDTVTNMTTNFAPGPDNTYVQTIVITGGTGRFQDATGNATITGTFDFGTFVYDGHLDGSISQPGPRK
jgi:hypothetical protein